MHTSDDSSEENRPRVDADLAIRTTEDQGTRTLALTGEIDLSNVETLAAELKAALEADIEEVVVDMRGLEFIDSTGIALLVNTMGESSAGRPAVTFIPSAAPAVSRVLEVTGLAERLPQAKTEQAE